MISALIIKYHSYMSHYTMYNACGVKIKSKIRTRNRVRVSVNCFLV